MKKKQQEKKISQPSGGTVTKIPDSRERYYLVMGLSLDLKTAEWYKVAEWFKAKCPVCAECKAVTHELSLGRGLQICGTFKDPNRKLRTDNHTSETKCYDNTTNIK